MSVVTQPQFEFTLGMTPPKNKRRTRIASLADQLAAFAEFGAATRVISTKFNGGETPTYVNEFWTARQRQASSLHEVQNSFT